MISKLASGLTAWRARHRSEGGRPSGRSSIGGSNSTSHSSSELVIEYRPEPDGAPDPGEVVWAWVAYEDDPTQGKDRPVVIIGRIGPDLAGIALTTKGDGRSDERIAVGSGPWDRQGRPSFAKVDRVLVIPADGVRREGSTFGREAFDRVVRATSEAGAGAPPRWIDARSAQLPKDGRRVTSKDRKSRGAGTVDHRPNRDLGGST